MILIMALKPLIALFIKAGFLPGIFFRDRMYNVSMDKAKYLVPQKGKVFGFHYK